MIDYAIGALVGSSVVCGCLYWWLTAWMKSALDRAEREIRRSHSDEFNLEIKLIGVDEALDRFRELRAEADKLAEAIERTGATK